MAREITTITSGVDVEVSETAWGIEEDAPLQQEKRSHHSSADAAFLPQDYEALAHELQVKVLHRTLKRMVDVFGASFLLVALSLLLLVVAACIRLSSPGPILFRQRRIGFRGEMFDFLKFRSMRVDQDQFVQSEDMEKMKAAGVLFKCNRDPRVTAIGRLIRRTSIDELPQLLNVLKGDMSLVGPRPLVPFMLDHHVEFGKIRGLVKPGLTGLWQIRARKFNTKADYMVLHDLEYVRNFSIFQDLKILLVTLPAVIVGDGAH